MVCVVKEQVVLQSLSSLSSDVPDFLCVALSKDETTSSNHMWNCLLEPSSFLQLTNSMNKILICNQFLSGPLDTSC